MGHMPPVVRPLPRLAVKLVVHGLFLVGLILLWMDRRESNKNRRMLSEQMLSEHKGLGVPAYK